MDKKYYHELHGFIIKRLKNRKWKLTIPYEIFKNNIVKGEFLEIPTICSALTSDNKCSFHGTDKKPSICKALNEETAKLDNIMITGGCIYGKEIKEM